MIVVIGIIVIGIIWKIKKSRHKEQNNVINIQHGLEIINIQFRRNNNTT